LRPAAEIPSEKELRREYEKLRAGLELMGSGLDLPTFLRRLIETAFLLVDAQRGAIVLIDPATSASSLHIARNRNGEVVELQVPSTILCEVMARKSGVVTVDAEGDERFGPSDSICRQEIRSAMCIPILHRGEVLGVMHLDSPVAGNVFSDADLELFSAITRAAAIAIRNASLLEGAHAVRALHWKRLLRIVEDLPAGVLLLDSAQQIVAGNEKAYALLPVLVEGGAAGRIGRLGGVPLETILARRSCDVTVPGRVFAVSASQPTSASSPATETVVTVSEVTEEREREMRETQQDRLALIGQLAGGIAHDFNNLITVISNYAVFVSDAAESPAMREDAEEIRSAAARAAELTRQLLAFGRREIVQPRVVDLNQHVAEMEKLLARTLGEQVELTTRLEAGHARVKADPSRIGQVLMNLAVNARDAMPQGGHLAVATGNLDLDDDAARAEGLLPGLYVSLSVLDDGSGMTPEVAAHVFEPFFTTKQRGKGTGLGLATVYGIVKQAGGSISLRSRPGEGSTFTVLLPATEEPLEEVAPAGAQAAKGGRETVLLVEDERSVRELTRRVLEQGGYSVLEACDAVQALEVAARNGDFDLLLTDVVMPGRSGKDLAAELREGRPGLPVLFMSGYFDSVGSPESPDGFVGKPFTRDELLVSVRGALSRC
jgi:signal transduction histidine kinase